MSQQSIYPLTYHIKPVKNSEQKILSVQIKPKVEVPTDTLEVNIP